MFAFSLLFILRRHACFFLKLSSVLGRTLAEMYSSITCCSGLEEQLRLDEFRSGYSSYGGSVHGFNSVTTERGAPASRRKREFTPDEQKDDIYWLKRSRNNESAKRSRLRRRMEECLLEARAVELLRENETLKAALSAARCHNTGGRNHLVDRLVCQGPSRESYLSSLVDFSTPGPDTQSPYSFASGGQGQRLGPDLENVTSPNILTSGVMGNIHQRDRNVTCYLGIPACPSGFPLTFEREAMQSHRSTNMTFYPSSYSGPFPLAPHEPRLVETQPGCGATHAQVTEDHVGGSGLFTRVTKEIGNEMKTTKGTERASVMPLLPHKLRYKVSKAWHDSKNWEIIHPSVQRVRESVALLHADHQATQNVWVLWSRKGSSFFGQDSV